MLATESTIVVKTAQMLISQEMATRGKGFTMPITMELRENGHVLYYEITDPWDLAELKTLYDQDIAIRDEHQYTIHAIANMSTVRILPQNVISVRSFSPDITHPRAGYVILVGVQSLIRSVVELAVRLVRSDKVLFTATDEEAWAKLRQIIQNEGAESSG